MDPIPDSPGHDRRSVLAGGALALAATGLGLAGPARAADPLTGLYALKQVDAGLLSTGYAELGPADGKPVILLHGWPYDIYSFVDVAPELANRGLRVIVPYLRGFGATRFLSDKTFRNGEPAAVAVDIIALRDALKIQRALLGGCDWSEPAGWSRSAAI
jgi:pimeloyl-ACP methyl ester carboxylesterase